LAEDPFYFPIWQSCGVSLLSVLSKVWMALPEGWEKVLQIFSWFLPARVVEQPEPLLLAASQAEAQLPGMLLVYLHLQVLQIVCLL
jgi:hypothetical protein